jgi:hypothetical protein
MSDYSLVYPQVIWRDALLSGVLLTVKKTSVEYTDIINALPLRTYHELLC